MLHLNAIDARHLLNSYMTMCCAPSWNVCHINSLGQSGVIGPWMNVHRVYVEVILRAASLNTLLILHTSLHKTMGEVKFR